MRRPLLREASSEEYEAGTRSKAEPENEKKRTTHASPLGTEPGAFPTFLYFVTALQRRQLVFLNYAF